MGSSLAGCAALPSSGPDANAVVKASQGPAPAFRIVDLTAATPADIAKTATTGAGSLVGVAQPVTPAAVDEIEVGDTLQITIFEVGAALFGSSSAAGSGAAAGMPAPTANAAALPPVPVGPDGSIAVPYVGRVEAAGHTPAEVAATIQDGLRGKSQSPQVVVSVREDQGNTVMMLGDIKNPGRRPLSYRRESLLDMIATAGGPTNLKADMIVRLTRNGRSLEMRLGDIESGSPNDVMMQPQDRVELVSRPRTFTAFGAAGKVSEIPFQTVHLSLAEAIARMGGPLDQQADSSGVFIFRAGQPASADRVVYRLNLKDPRGFFVAQGFEIEDKDIVFVANAQSNAWYKFLSILNTVVTPVVTAKYLGH